MAPIDNFLNLILVSFDLLNDHYSCRLGGQFLLFL